MSLPQSPSTTFLSPGEYLLYVNKCLLDKQSNVDPGKFFDIVEFVVLESSREGEHSPYIACWVFGPGPIGDAGIHQLTEATGGQRMRPRRGVLVRAVIEEIQTRGGEKALRATWKKP